jgi:serine/threonine protein kinase
MGQVYRARDERLDRTVAIKLLPARFSDDPMRLRRFELEVRLAGSLSHPNVLGVYDVGRHESSPFIVTELLEGQTLRDRLRGRYLTAARALEISRQLIAGLAAAHAKGIIHRDLKPSNVFLCADGPVKILDFGVAKLVHRDPQTGEPTTGWTTEALPGTVGYLAPEQAHGRRIDHRVDIFAFGCVLYEMLSGQKDRSRGPGGSPSNRARSPGRPTRVTDAGLRTTVRSTASATSGRCRPPGGKAGGSPSTGRWTCPPGGHPQVIPDLDISPDGRWLVLVEVDRRGDVWLLEASEGSF